MRNFIGSIAVLSFLCFFAGCGGKTVAVVNGQTITQGELDRALEEVEGKSVLDTLVGRKLVEQDAAKKNITVTDQEVDKQLDELKKSLNLNTLSKNRETIVRDDVRFNLLLQKTILATVPESKIKEYYDRNKDLLPEVELDSIVVADKKQAMAIRDALTRGQEFSTLAGQFSQDAQSRQRGGYVGYVSRGNLQQVSPAIAKIAFSLPKGVLSPIIKSPKGWYILKVLNKKESLSDLRENIERQMATDRAKAYLDDLRSKAKIDYKGEFQQQP